MGYEIVGGPFLLMETVAMLHKYVNGISFQAAISRQRFFMGNPDYQAQSAKMSRLQAIMEELCAELDTTDPGCSITSPAPGMTRRACVWPRS